MNNFLIFVLLLGVMACQSEPKPPQSESGVVAPKQMAALRAPAPDQEEPPQSTDSSPQPQATANRKIIRNANLRIRVSDFTASGKKIEQLVQQHGGQITSSNETKTYNTIENALVIRVPAAHLDELLASTLSESIFTDTKIITAEDVTRQYVDTEARVRSKKAVEETYLKLLKQARNVEEVLKIEEQLANIREEREVQEAELRQLKDEVALSTVNLTYYQQTDIALNPEEPFYKQIWHNLSDGFQLIGNVFVGLFYFIPIGLIIGAVIWLFARWRKKRRNAGK